MKYYPKLQIRSSIGFKDLHYEVDGIWEFEKDVPQFKNDLTCVLIGNRFNINGSITVEQLPELTNWIIDQSKTMREAAYTRTYDDYLNDLPPIRQVTNDLVNDCHRKYKELLLTNNLNPDNYEMEISLTDKGVTISACPCQTINGVKHKLISVNNL